MEYYFDKRNINVDEAVRICSLAISPHGKKNQLIWIGTLNENFSIKRAYLHHIEKERILEGKWECSKVSIYSSVWKRIWKMRILRMFKMFLWRVYNNLLPTKENLCKKMIMHDPLCFVRDLIAGTIGHIIWSCPSSTNVWTKCNRKSRKYNWWKWFVVPLWKANGVSRWRRIGVGGNNS